MATREFHPYYYVIGITYVVEESLCLYHLIIVAAIVTACVRQMGRMPHLRRFRLGVGAAAGGAGEALFETQG